MIVAISVHFFFFHLSLSSSVFLGGKISVSRRVPAENHPCHCENVLLHRPSYEDTTSAAGVEYSFGFLAEVIMCKILKTSSAQNSFVLFKY